MIEEEQTPPKPVLNPNRFGEADPSSKSYTFLHGWTNGTRLRGLATASTRSPCIAETALGPVVALGPGPERSMGTARETKLRLTIYRQIWIDFVNH